MKAIVITLLALVARVCLGDDATAVMPDKFIVSKSARVADQRFANLVAIRAQAIGNALGPILEGACTSITIKLAMAGDDDFPRGAQAAYNPGRHTLTFRRDLRSGIGNGVKSWAKAYWPYYQNEDVQALLPVIGIIDEALWAAHLQEAAHRKGMAWPHRECSSQQLEMKLGCDMLMSGVQRSRRGPQIFNANRVDVLWPESLEELRARAWNRRDGAYREVAQLGGTLLVRPLFAEFGVPRVLQYIAQTPFHIEDDNVRLSALHYQEQARQALSADAIN